MTRFVLPFVCLLMLLPALVAPPVTAQERVGELDRVMMLTGEDRGGEQLQADRGSAGLWQRLQKLQTTGSVLHVLAHPDDEHGGVLAYLSRGEGARVAQLTLNRGEGGANAIGSELFDELGLVRTEELLQAAAYYGLDDLYFTTLIDYGFSKTLDEALRNWGRENVLRDVVRVIRLNRPFVILARFHGSERDGHGHHQTAGVIAQEVFRAAGDPNVFPEQIEEGLRPWQPLKMYRGGVRDDEPFNVLIDAGTYSPWLGQSYRNFASRGLSFQRSQTSGAFRETLGPYLRHYERMDATVESPTQEADLFAGIDTSLPALFAVLGVEGSPEARALLEEIAAHVDEAVAAFQVDQPAAVVSPLAAGLARTRDVLQLVEDPEVRFHLQVKEQQFIDAINTALGTELRAVGIPGDAEVSDSPWAPSPTMGVVVPGQTFRVMATLHNPSSRALEVQSVAVEASAQWDGSDPAEGMQEIRTGASAGGALGHNESLVEIFEVTVPDQAEYSDRYFRRESIRQSRYTVEHPEYLHRPNRPPVLTAVATYEVDGVPIEIRETVRTRESNIPFGYEMRSLKIAPTVAVNVRPEMRIVPSGGGGQSFDLQVELVNNRRGPASGELRLEAPAGWQVEPERQPFSFTQAGQRQSFTLDVTLPGIEEEDYVLEAVAVVDGEEYRTGYEVISHRDYDTQYIYRPAVTTVRAVEVEIAPDLQVGYVMGVGDEVPSGIEQLGAEVQLLGRDDLATGDLGRFDAIVVGTRAYAVRQDLWTYNQRLLDFARDGGHLIVLYNTQEMVPNDVAPYPAELPRSAEEVSEEDAPVRILAPDHPVFNQPNRITMADFEGWVEQRGSKFFSEWDPAYTPMIETQDQGQDPQQGGWLTAEYGEGYYTYFAYAVHRQMPYGVPGAYRIFANVLSLGQ